MNIIQPDTITHYLCIVKKLVLIVLISIYTTATFGIGVKSFYCCNKLKSTTITFTVTAKEKCNTKGMKGGCCKTKFQFFKVKDNHVAADNVISPAKSFTDLHFTIPSFQMLTAVPQQIIVAHYSNAPPLHNGLPIYIFNCVYRI